ncbi:MAG TPA: efflux RND transporter periplasmic adaptor subunit [Rubrivivax sp.]|nr:efflux RND transporter periplasmic adaptor subunit [Rubrivivax sp.]
MNKLCAVAALVLATQGVGAYECLLEPWQVVEVRSAVDGIIASIAVQRGDTIRPRQPLVVLSSEPERAAIEAARYRVKMDGQIAAARNRIDYATKKLERLENLQKGNYASVQSRDESDAEKRLAESELQSAMESREMARLELRRAEEVLAMRTMVAPFAGVVLDRMLNPGDLAESGSGRKPVLKVAQIDPLRADVALPAALFGSVKPGAKGSVAVAIGNTRYPATVRSVDRVIDSASGTFVARLEVPNPSGQAPAGGRCVATIDGVPVSAGTARRPVP